MTSNRDAMSITDALRQFEGQVAWGVTAGTGTGSRVLLRFGHKVRRRTPLTNPALDENARTYDSEYSIFIEDGRNR